VPFLQQGFREHLRNPGGRFVTFVGPRFRPQDMVCLTRHDQDWTERSLGRMQAPIVAGPAGWLKEPRLPVQVSP
jgi:hypothetical protein